MPLAPRHELPERRALPVLSSLCCCQAATPPNVATQCPCSRPHFPRSHSHFLSHLLASCRRRAGEVNYFYSLDQFKVGRCG